jgi:CheY-like chemotaxis protein
MLLNLINNALQAVGGREQGKVELRVEELSAADGLSLALEGPLAGWVRLVVEDDGCGMAADIMGRIFEPLFTTKEKRMGTGMGLAAVHSIVQRHHGRISVESQPGKGTTFAIYFPKVEVDLAEASRLGDRPFQAPDPGTRVLVVDDNVQVLSALQDVFTLHGLEADVLDSADEALSILLDKSRVYDLIIIDYMMPDRDGVDFIRELRRHGIDVPVILASGFPEEVMKKVGAYLNDCSNPKQLNMKAIIQKPFIYRKLLSTMAESLKPES